MRVLSYNIHKGFSLGNRQWVLEEIRRAIRETQADIVCLQEVVGENQRRAVQWHQWVDQQFEFLADQVWTYKTYGKNAVYDYGHHGNAILSKIPLVQFANHNMSVMPLSQRGVLHAVTEEGVHVLCAHLGLLSWERQRQARRLCDVLRSIPADAPLILAGDFNDWNGKVHRSVRRLGLREANQEVAGTLPKTFPAHFPVLRMDRIYYRHLRLVEAHCLREGQWRRLSDHCPLYAEFRRE
jgi:endonuclease/exonuclease/phosphatase family metal-dependent hydrolase